MIGWIVAEAADALLRKSAAASLGFRLGSTLQLGSVVDGNEVSNPFVVTEVYVQQAEGWTLASMSFTRLVTHS